MTSQLASKKSGLSLSPVRIAPVATNAQTAGARKKRIKTARTGLILPHVVWLDAMSSGASFRGKRAAARMKNPAPRIKVDIPSVSRITGFTPSCLNKINEISLQPANANAKARMRLDG